MKPYTLKNLLTDGSFETGTTNWGYYNSSYAPTFSSSYHIVGSKSVYVNSTNSNAIKEQAVVPKTAISLIANHKYYLCVRAYMTSFTSGFTGVMYVPNAGYIAASSTTLNSWQKVSNVVSCSSSTTTKDIRIGKIYGNSAIMNVALDAAMLIDLTEAFGSGNEPTKAVCDTYIPFFEGTKNVEFPISSGLARKVKSMYVGIGGKARRIKRGYIGVNGKAHLFYNIEPYYAGYVKIHDYSLSDACCAWTGKYALISGGSMYKDTGSSSSSYSTSKTTFAVQKNKTVTTVTTDEPISCRNKSGGHVGNYAILSDRDGKYIAYNSSLVRTTGSFGSTGTSNPYSLVESNGSTLYYSAGKTRNLYNINSSLVAGTSLSKPTTYSGVVARDCFNNEVIMGGYNSRNTKTFKINSSNVVSEIANISISSYGAMAHTTNYLLVHSEKSYTMNAYTTSYVQTTAAATNSVANGCNTSFAMVTGNSLGGNAYFYGGPDTHSWTYPYLYIYKDNLTATSIYISWEDKNDEGKGSSTDSCTNQQENFILIGPGYQNDTLNSNNYIIGGLADIITL